MNAGEGCPRCDGVLDVYKALEVGHIFKLGTKYSSSMQATVLDAEGKQVPIVMGSYGIGVERILAAAIELHHDDNGIRWPMAIAPLQATVLTLGPEPEIKKAAEELVEALAQAGVEVLFDDRDERAGVKFKDADLIGIPLRLAIGKKGLAGGNAEWKLRGGEQVELVPFSEVPRRAAELVRGGRVRALTGRYVVRIRIGTGAEGEVVLPPAQAEALGLAGGGQGELLSARGAFALLLPARGDEPGAWFAGSLAAVTVPEVVQFIFTSLKTGVLLLSFGEGRAWPAPSRSGCGARASTSATARSPSPRPPIAPTGWGRCCGGRGRCRSPTWSAAPAWSGAADRSARCWWTRACSRPGSSTRGSRSR